MTPPAAADPAVTLEAHGAIGGVRVAYTAAYQAGAGDQQVWTFVFWGLLSGSCDAAGSPSIGFKCIDARVKFSTGGTGAPVAVGVDQHTVTVNMGGFTGNVLQTVVGGT